MLDNGEFETAETSLPAFFTLEDIKELYNLRWSLETAARDWKYTLGLVNLHGKSDTFAERKIYASLTAFNFAGRICHEAVVHQPKDGVYAYKVNFKMAVRCAVSLSETQKPTWTNLLLDMGRYTVLIRPGRQDQRKLRVKGFPGFVCRVTA